MRSGLNSFPIVPSYSSFRALFRCVRAYDILEASRVATNGINYVVPRTYLPPTIDFLFHRDILQDARNTSVSISPTYTTASSPTVKLVTYALSHCQFMLLHLPEIVSGMHEDAVRPIVGPYASVGA